MEVVVDKLTAEGKKFMKELEELGRLQVRVGFQRGRDPRDEEKEDSKKDYPDMCDIAAWNELGTSNGTPSRPFMRDSADKHMDEIYRMMEAQAVLLTRGVSAKQILQNLGNDQKNRMALEIVDGKFEKNANSVKERKERKSRHNVKKGEEIVVKPLIDTGQMRQAVNFFICQRGEYD